MVEVIKCGTNVETVGDVVTINGTVVPWPCVVVSETTIGVVPLNDD